MGVEEVAEIRGDLRSFLPSKPSADQSNSRNVHARASTRRYAILFRKEQTSQRCATHRPGLVGQSRRFICVDLLTGYHQGSMPGRALISAVMGSSDPGAS
jgi:hypothetical protein